MKQFLCKIFVFFVVPISIYLGFKETVMRSEPNSYAYKNQWLTDNANRVHVLILGSSHGIFGIDPSVFTKKAFNAAHVSQTLEFDAFIIDKFIDQMNSLEYVILPVSYFSLYDKGLRYSVEPWRVKYYTIYYDCPYYKYNPKYSLMCYEFDPKATLNAITNTDTSYGCDSLGFIATSLDERSTDWKDSGKTAAKRHTNLQYNKAILSRNIGYIHHIISKCQKKGINVILVTTPTYYTYYNSLNKHQLQQTITSCQTIANKYSNTVYLNYLKSPIFNENDFQDADHLNKFGALKLTSLLEDNIFH